MTHVETVRDERGVNIVLSEIHYEVLDLLKDCHFHRITEEKDIQLEEYIKQGSSISTLKTTSILRVNISKLCNLLYNPTLDEKRQYDVNMLNQKIIRRFEDGKEIILLHLKSPSKFINDREILYVKKRIIEEGYILILFKSVDIEEVKVKNGFIRGNISGCYYLENMNDNEVKMISIVTFDPKGWIPSFILNFFKNNEIQKMKKLKDLIN